MAAWIQNLLSLEKVSFKAEKVPSYATYGKSFEINRPYKCVLFISVKIVGASCSLKM